MKKIEKYPSSEQEPEKLHDRMSPEGKVRSGDAMVRTQIYLTKAEHSFLLEGAGKRGEPMSAYLRSIIDEKMAVPDEAWANNPLLNPTPEAPEFEGTEDASVNHDHYAFGAPKKFKKVRNQWIMKGEGEE